MGYSSWGHRESDRTKHAHTENTQQETRNEKKHSVHSLKALSPNEEVVQFSLVQSLSHVLLFVTP